jgi:hypothetical protein
MTKIRSALTMVLRRWAMTTRVHESSASAGSTFVSAGRSHWRRQWWAKRLAVAIRRLDSGLDATRCKPVDDAAFDLRKRVVQCVRVR